MHPMTSKVELELLRQLSEQVNVTTREGSKAVEKRAILVSHLVKMATDKNLPALKLALEMATGAEIKQKQEMLMSVEVALDYVRACKQHTADCIAAGQEPPNFLPHPEDLDIYPDRVGYLGPMTEAQHVTMLKVVNLRDEVLRTLSEYVTLAPEHEHGGPAYLSYKEALDELQRYNTLLPPRLRKDFSGRASFRGPTMSARDIR
jgi:hypothetical protein